MPSIFRKSFRHHNPLRATYLPLIARLRRIGFHKYRRRLTKRLFKKPGRWLFDAAYGSGLGGTGRMAIDLPGGSRTFRFDGRHGHFGMVYMHPEHLLFEPGVAALLDAFATGPKVFYDVGANWGMLSLYAATLPGFRGPIHAFEPVPLASRDLIDIVRQLGLESRIACHEVAASDRAGTARMKLPLAGDTGWSKISDDGDMDVRAARLDDMDLPDPDFIKLDVEGHEFQALFGARARLRRARPHVVLENWLELQTPNITADPLRLLEDEGYGLFIPCWQYARNGAPFLWPDAHPPTPERDQTFVLVPVTSEQRFLMSRHLSVYACPSERMNELRAAFEEIPRLM
ncbi:MAG: FkbM family methyltransferase [Rhodospirillales bacterium]|nr:FkbM family methyltransferase [Rhodospirillales bacterium]